MQKNAKKLLFLSPRRYSICTNPHHVHQLDILNCIHFMQYSYPILFIFNHYFQKCFSGFFFGRFYFLFFEIPSLNPTFTRWASTNSSNTYYLPFSLLFTPHLPHLHQKNQFIKLHPKKKNKKKFSQTTTVKDEAINFTCSHYGDGFHSLISSNQPPN